VAEQPERQRIKPTRQGQARLLADLRAMPPVHLVDAGTLGEYAEVLMAQGQAAADALLPEVAEHLESGCTRCDADLDELVALLEEPDDAPSPAADARSAAWAPAASLPMTPPVRSDARDLVGSARGLASSDEGASDAHSGGDDQQVWGTLPGDRPNEPAQTEASRPRRTGAPADSGVFASDLPDARAVEAEAARRQRLRRIRDLLLIAAAVSVLLLGLSLVGLAYLARQAPDPVRVPLMPLAPSGSEPGQPNAPSGQSGAQSGAAPVTGAAPAPAAGASGARAVPEGNNCPASHPVKGNRESRIYHVPSGTSYAATRPEVCYATPADAEVDGYRRSQR
jgi:hypothetical protein